jgi:hypothetical protein
LKKSRSTNEVNKKIVLWVLINIDYISQYFHDSLYDMKTILELSKLNTNIFKRAMILNLDVNNIHIVKQLHDDYHVALPSDTFNIAARNNDIELAEYASLNMTISNKIYVSDDTMSEIQYIV